MPSKHTQTLSAAEFHRLLDGGYRNLKAHGAEVDALNVFPVPDGDTGKNMGMTLGGGVARTDPAGADVGDYMRAFSRNALLSARGNSGVILSQFIRGIAKAAEDAGTLTPALFAAACRRGAEQAYRAVSKPVEGTILTLMREGADYLGAHEFADFEACFEGLVNQQREALARTPEQLAVLKEAGVVDSGGAGLVCILEGMRMALLGEWTEDAQAPAMEAPVAAPVAQGAGDAPRKRYGVVAVASGEGIIRLLRENGADAVIDGGHTRNPSSQELLEAIAGVNAEHVVVLPNDGNIILTARQAAALCEGTDVRVLETRSFAEGYAALSIMNPDLESPEALLREMAEGAEGVETGLVTRAIRDSELQGRTVREGDWLGLRGHEILAVAESPESAALGLLAAISGMEERSVITAFHDGKPGRDERDAIASGVSARWPEIEFGFEYGGQDVYRYIFVIE